MCKLMFYCHLVFKSYRKIVQTYLLSKTSILVVSLQKIKNQKAQISTISLLKNQYLKFQVFLLLYSECFKMFFIDT